jgi:hypothetical protein
VPQEHIRDEIAGRSCYVSIPDRVLGFLCLHQDCPTFVGDDVSIPDRVLGFLCLPIAEALLYLAFKVQFRESSIKVPFQPVTCQYPNFNSRFKTLSCKAYRISVNDFFK